MGRFVFFKWYFEKKWVGRAIGNETIYWAGLRIRATYRSIATCMFSHPRKLAGNISATM